MANLNWLRLPEEMRRRRQWAVSTLMPLPDGKVDKAPRNPTTRELASAVDPSSWGTFEEAVNSGLPGIGYMLSEDDPFTIIDLDDKGDLTDEMIARHRKIYSVFDSYAESSQSGNGVHIILRGKIGGGMNRDGVEIYDQERYIICTGNALRNSDIRAHDELLAQLVHEMGGITVGAEGLPDDGQEIYTDAEILDRARSARNGDHFKDLYDRLPGEGDDWSHRDAQLAQMIAFYTRNHEQALRLFRGSALYRPNSKGKNPQHYEQYYLLTKTFGRAWRAEIARDADLDHGKKLAAQLLAPKPAQPDSPHTGSLTPVPGFPGGLIGLIAAYIYAASPRPVREIALAAALAFCAGILGRQFNVGGTGLNLYVVLLADTGRGKEAGPSGVESLVTHLRNSIPSIELFMGPAAFGSGQGLVRALDKNPTMFSPLGEFGHLLQTITDRRAGANEIKMRQMLLTLFSKSGKGQMLRATAYSDTEKNTKNVESPAFSFLGDTTAEAYYASVSSGAIAEGLLPRFLTISYEGPRVPLNEEANSNPSTALADHLGSVVTTVITMQQNNTFTEVSFTEAAREADRAFNKFCDDKINEPGASAMAEIWNRAHLKMRRVAALLAVGRNHMAPIITPEDIAWAIQLLRSDIDRVAHRLGSGDVGTGDNRRVPAIQQVVKDFLQMDAQKRKVYKVPLPLLDKQIIPYAFFRRRLQQNASFYNDPRGPTFAIKGALQDAVELGVLQKLSEEQRLMTMGKKSEGDLYAVGENFD